MSIDNGFTGSRASSPFDDPTRMGGANIDAPKERPSHDLNSPKSFALLRRLQEWYDQEWQRQAANRLQMALDCDYYDGLQWSEEDAQVLMNRGQAPLVFNEVKPVVDWIIGTERKTRIDYKVLGREKNDNDQAQAKTQLLKYLDDVNKSRFHRSHAFSDAVRAGVGWLEVGLRGDPTEEMLSVGAESWRNILYDSADTTRDLSNSRYLFRWKMLDEDLAKAYFPDRANVISRATSDGLSITDEGEEDIWYMGARVTAPGEDYAGASVGRFTPIDHAALAWSRRPRVKLIECWYREPVLRRRFSGGEFAREIYDGSNPAHLYALAAGYSLYDKLEMSMRVAVFTSMGLLYEGETPFRHNRFPFVPIWCYRRQRDNAPYGVIRQQRDPQDDLNKRRSKALHILSTNQVEMEDGAVEDIEELREEAARPDGILIRKRGSELKLHRDVQLAEEQLTLMDRNAAHIRNSAGVTAENLGRETNANSGKAVIARQEQGVVVTAEIFDNLRHAMQLLGELELAAIEQFYDQPKVIRVLGERGAAKYYEINTPNPETGETLNDITAAQADFVVSEQDFKSSLRQAMFESLFDIVGRLAQMNPAVALNLLDLVVEMADIPGRDELVARIRKINGQRDPDSDLTPEEQQAEHEQAAKQAEMQQLEVDRLRAELENTRAKTKDLVAAAVKKGVEAAYSAIQTGQVIAQMPLVAPLADEVMRSQGYEQPNPAGQDPNFPIPAATAGQIPAVDFPGNTNPMTPASPASPDVGVRDGIETRAADGLNPNQQGA